jgi:hypothetical protein
LTGSFFWGEGKGGQDVKLTISRPCRMEVKNNGTLSPFSLCLYDVHKTTFFVTLTWLRNNISGLCL